MSVIPAARCRSTRPLADFRAFHENRKKFIEVNGKPKQVGLGTWWLRHEHRQQYERVVFDPGAAPNPDVLNLWRGFAVEPDDSRSCSLFLAHITDDICSGNDEHATYLLDLLAWGVQNPGKRAEVAVVLRGDEGTGKGKMVHSYGALFGSHYHTFATGAPGREFQCASAADTSAVR